MSEVSWDKIFQKFHDKYVLGKEIKDPGYSVFEKFFNSITNDYTVYLLIIATIFFVALGFFIYKYSKNPYISYVLFSTLFYSFFAITGHRQTIATALVVLIGTFLIHKKKFIPFVLVVLLASTIHMSCICFLPFYFISKIRINKATLIGYWVAIIGSFLFRYQLFEFLQSLIGYENYTENKGAQAGTFLVLLIIFGILITMFHKRLLEYDESGIVSIAINAVMAACFFSSLLLINQSMMRVVQYFSIFLLILLPEFGKAFAKQRDLVLYNILVVIVLIALFAMNGPTYKFFWQ